MMAQSDRISSLAKFKGGVVNILLATDVGSRGLDIPTVEVVINYEVPASAVDYIHRVGRTARAGRAGISVSLVAERDIECVLNIEAKISMFDD
jgi:ATP-dependent RNA helicase DDX49/DBP8